jgi:hypothetical protein
MINFVLGQSGTTFNDQQLKLLEDSLKRARQALEGGDVQGAVREMNGLVKLGQPGQLGSFAEAAIEIDRLAEELAVKGRAALAAAKAQLEKEDTVFAGALALAQTRRTYVTLPALKEQVTAELARVRADDQLRGTFRLAEQLDEARSLLENPAGRRRAPLALRRLIEQNPDTQAAAIARELLSEHFPDEVPNASPNDYHKWTSVSGTTMVAALTGYGYSETAKAAYVRLQPKDGEAVAVLLTQLSAESQELAKKMVQEMRATE